MKVWHGYATVDLRSLSVEIIKKYGMQDKFANPDEPTKEEVRKYFEDKLQYYAESNTGSEALACAVVEIEVNDLPPSNLETL